MDPEEQQARERQRHDLIRREMMRKSMDRVRVLNPRSEDYIVFWDKFPNRVPANGKAIFPRYIAKKYVSEMTDKILTYKMDEQVKMENERRIKKGVAAMNKWEEEPVFAAKFAINQPELREPIMRELWGGVVEEYGRDVVPQDQLAKPVDLRAEDEKIFDKLNTVQPTNPIPPHEMPQEVPLPEVSVEETSQQVTTLAEEITNE